MKNSFPAPPPPPSKCRQSGSESGNSIRYEGTECIDMTASVAAAAPPPPPRKVSFFDVPLDLNLSPAHMSSDSHSQDSLNEIKKTFACNVPMEMSVVAHGNGNPALSTSTCYEAMTMDMSREDLYFSTESLIATADVSREDTAHAHADTKNIPLDMSCADATGTHGITKNIPFDMSCEVARATHGDNTNNTVNMSFEDSDSVSENSDRNHNPASESLHTLFETSLKPAPPPPPQQTPVRLVHPLEITARPKTQNLVADNSQNLDFLLRYAGSSTAQKCSHPIPTDGYGQFGSVRTPRKGWQTQSQQSYQALVAMASLPQPQLPQPLIQKAFLSSVEMQTSPLTTYISAGTSITPKVPQQKTRLDDIQDTHQFEGCLVQQQQKSMNTTTIGIGGSAVDETEKSIEEVRRSLESGLISMGNGNSGLTREIPSRAFHVSVPCEEYDNQDQSTIFLNVCNNSTLFHETLLGPDLVPGAIRNDIFDKSLSAPYQSQAQLMTSAANANLNLSKENGFGLTEEDLPPHLTVNDGGNVTFRAESTTTTTQETFFVVSSHQRQQPQQRQREERPIVAAATALAQAQVVAVAITSSTSGRNLMLTPTPRGPATIKAPGAGAGLLLTPQSKSNSSVPPSMGLGPLRAKERILDLSLSVCGDPQELCFLAWESHLGQKTRDYLKNYGTMSDCTKARNWAPIREELLKLTRVDFEKFAADFAHAFPEWFMPTVLSYFEVQEIAAIPLHEFDTHPTIVNITGGPEVTRAQTMEEVLASLNWCLRLEAPKSE